MIVILHRISFLCDCKEVIHESCQLYQGCERGQIASGHSRRTHQELQIYSNKNGEEVILQSLFFEGLRRDLKFARSPLGIQTLKHNYC